MSRSPLPNKATDFWSNLPRILVLPHPHDHPPIALERFGHPPIALDVAHELRRPVGGVTPWLGAVGRTRVPEAAVDEQRYACAGEYDVRAYSDPPCNHPLIDTEAQAPGVQQRPQPPLRAGIAATVRTHPL